MRILWILAVVGSLYPSAQAFPRPVSPPARLIDVHVHVWEPMPSDPSFRDSLLAAFDAFHLERGVVSGPDALVPGVVSLSPDRLLGGVVYGAGYDLPPPATRRTVFSA